MLSIIFAGTPQFAVPCLQALIDSEHKISAVYTQPDRPAGRGRQLHASPVKTLAAAHHLPVFQPETLKDPAEQTMLQALNADLMVVVAYGLILPKAILTAPKYGCINVHASLLPRWRGAAPIQQAILAGDKQTGVTIMQMDAGLDTGPMLNTITCPIQAHDTAESLSETLAGLGADALLIAIDAIVSGRAKATPQPKGQATYAHKLSKAQAALDWQQPAQQLLRAIRAYQPWPVAYSELDGQTIKIYAAEALAEHSEQAPGTIISACAAGIHVSTGKGVLQIQECQLPGGKRLPVAAMLNAHQAKFAAGKRFVDSVSQP